MLYQQVYDISADGRNSPSLCKILNECVVLFKQVEDFEKSVGKHHTQQYKFRKLFLANRIMLNHTKKLLQGKLNNTHQKMYLSWKLKTADAEKHTKNENQITVNEKKIPANLMPVKEHPKTENNKSFNSAGQLKAVVQLLGPKTSKARVNKVSVKKIPIKNQYGSKSGLNSEEQKLIDKFGKNSSVLSLLETVRRKELRNNVNNSKKVMFRVVRPHLLASNGNRLVYRQ